MKYLILLILLFAAVWLWTAHTRGKSRRPGGKPGAAEDMVQCAQCGVHLPLSESVESPRGYYCSSEHRRLGESAGR